MSLPYELEELTFREQGSIRFTDEQRAAYRMILDVEIISFVKEEYANLKSLPRNGFWGYATVFHGSSPIKLLKVEFAKQRLLDVIRQDILNTGLTVTSHLQTVSSIANLAEALSLDPVVSPWATPTVLANPETVVKFKSQPLTQFVFKLYWLPFEAGTVEALLFNSEDPTDGGNEYPEPRRNLPGDPWANNPIPSPFDPDSDDRDYGNQNNPFFPAVVYFGVQVTLSSGVGQPDNCEGDVEIFENFVWTEAGPPPYTFEIADIASPCSGRSQGYFIRADDGTTSPIRAEAATVFSGQINVFQFTPFEP